MPFRLGRPLTLLAALPVLAAAAPAADAASLSVSGSTAIYTAAPGEGNVVRFTTSGPDLVVVDDAAPVTGAGPCTSAIAGGQATCPLAGITAISAQLGDMGDRAT